MEGVERNEIGGPTKIPMQRALTADFDQQQRDAHLIVEVSYAV